MVIGVTQFVEVGAIAVLTAMVFNALPDADIVPVAVLRAGHDEPTTTLSAVGQVFVGVVARWIGRRWCRWVCGWGCRRMRFSGSGFGCRDLRLVIRWGWVSVGLIIRCWVRRWSSLMARWCSPVSGRWPANPGWLIMR